ncbi:MAG: type II toxin-antitoxin system RelE/ParE family toxin [Rhodospirillales bacterium]|nr:type II toxin-antitoxin system RelE/ParE family toxin [Rhodospirillales bacterium]
MRRVVWSDSGLEEFSSVVDYIARDNPIAAVGVADRLEAAVLALAELPVGRKGRVAGTYEKLVSGLPYIIAYALGDEPPEDGTLTVLRIIHGARDWPEGSWPGG